VCVAGQPCLSWLFVGSSEGGSEVGAQKIKPVGKAPAGLSIQSKQ